MMNLKNVNINYCIHRTKSAIEILFVFGDKRLADALTEFLTIPLEQIPETLRPEFEKMSKRCTQLPKGTETIAWNVLHMHWQHKRKIKQFLWDFLQSLEEEKIRMDDK